MLGHEHSVVLGDSDDRCQDPLAAIPKGVRKNTVTVNYYMEPAIRAFAPSLPNRY